MKLLIAFGTTEGQTRKICEYIRDEAKKEGVTVSMSDTTGPHLQPKGFDAAVIAASVHYGEYQTSLEHFVEEHSDKLNQIPTLFLSVSLTAASDEPESWKELEQITAKFLEKTGWYPNDVEQVAGALRYSKYNFFKKFIMRLIAQKSGGSTDTSKDHEYTDWAQVKNALMKLINYVEEKEQASADTSKVE
ncbi:menaquinone-dependent protoporphyrinogen IX dehydrogenase [Aliifodinibius sp. S!AR15-10]|uniref:menaquinone-dependent protoporphyrinogen IX dehydrogenase n=1 Tax=Aliifodinibius sp. S!AR15-10 TaxID=2950437 RepID=UPI002860319F|nr:menaquinone-dependent protoporphyrinogen IX dehydrogenase [Aliifodinibius sp. S!AR15-10]MDR8393267.1 menaquinone-dependent protoporphyrinogen IX dehydrogenase [Aliifodinibius sp. S!AR15-10]